MIFFYRTLINLIFILSPLIILVRLLKNKEDLKRFKYIKRWLKKYHETGEMNNHLLLNHIIIIFNCWDDAVVPMMFYKIESKYWTYLKSFFIYLDRLHEYPHTGIHELDYDVKILQALRGL